MEIRQCKREKVSKNLKKSEKRAREALSVGRFGRQTDGGLVVVVIRNSRCLVLARHPRTKNSFKQRPPLGLLMTNSTRVSSQMFRSQYNSALSWTKKGESHTDSRLDVI